MLHQVTEHAMDRVAGRAQIGIVLFLSIVSEESRHILIHAEESKRPFKIRRLKINERRWVLHKLFYSWAVRYWFVALQDKKSGRVITVHPVCFMPHQRHVTPEQLVRSLGMGFPQLTYQGGR